MRSTRATAAVTRLNQRSTGHEYSMAITGAGLFVLNERTEAGERRVCEPVPLDEFVRLVDDLGPQQVRRMTKNDVAFAKQLKRNSNE
jgi:hypothetical protein